MADLIARYRQELEVDLRRKVPAYSAQMIADEVELHLRERCEAAMELGATLETAQLEAIQGFGSPGLLSREFTNAAPVWSIAPLAGNLVMFGLFMIPVIYEYGFLQFDYVNLLTVASWIIAPALCRRWPIWGSLLGLLVIEVTLVLLPGRAVLADIAGMMAMMGITLASYLTGWLIRRVIARVRDRHKFPLARS